MLNSAALCCYKRLSGMESLHREQVDHDGLPRTYERVDHQHVNDNAGTAVSPLRALYVLIRPTFLPFDSFLFSPTVALNFFITACLLPRL